MTAPKAKRRGNNPTGQTTNRWLPGASPLGGGKTLSEKVAIRTIAETYRNLASPDEIGRALLSVFAGVDPHARATPGPDGVPAMTGTIDWAYRLAAIKLWHEYGYGKPMQGVVVDAFVRQETRVVDDRSQVRDLRELAATSPAAKAALRALGRAMLGTGREVVTVPRAADEALELEGAHELADVVDVHPEGAGEGGDGGAPEVGDDLVEDAAAAGGDGLGHDHKVAPAADVVKAERNGIRHPGAVA